MRSAPAWPHCWAAGGAVAHQRFEKPAVPAVADGFQGLDFPADGSRCHPLTIVDDHSRYGLCLEACGNEQGSTVQGRLQLTFRRYGLPEALRRQWRPVGRLSGQRWTRLCVWLLKLGIAVLHSRPYHPQSRGKNERFHRTLNAEVLALRRFRVSPRCSAPSTPGALSTISNGRTRHSTRRCRPAAIGRAPAPCRTAFHRWNTTSTKSCARFPS